MDKLTVLLVDDKPVISGIETAKNKGGLGGIKYLLFMFLLVSSPQVLTLKTFLLKSLNQKNKRVTRLNIKKQRA